MGGIDTQLAEDVLAVGGDGVDAGVALGGYLLGGLALGNGLDDVALCGGQQPGLLVVLLLGDDGLEGALADVALVVAHGLQGVANLLDGTVLEDDAEQVGSVDHLAQERRCELVADEHPVGQREALADNDELVDVGEVEQRIVEQHDGALVLL